RLDDLLHPADAPHPPGPLHQRQRDAQRREVVQHEAVRLPSRALVEDVPADHLQEVVLVDRDDQPRPRPRQVLAVPGHPVNTTTPFLSTCTPALVTLTVHTGAAGGGGGGDGGGGSALPPPLTAF